MTVAKKQVGVKKTTTPKPKFGEVGFKFPVMAEIVAVNPEHLDYEYPFVVSVYMGDYEDFSNENDKMEFQYPTVKAFKEFYSKIDPKFLKTQKQEELKQAQALVAKLTKEINELK